MPPVPLLRPGEIITAFEKLGWRVARRHGSHIILTKVGHISTLSVPNHPQVAWYAAEFSRSRWSDH
jgi:predicted RNA binding protein YcfA (HicA-like mRNA interferase family)